MMALDLESGSVWRWMIICSDDAFADVPFCSNKRELRTDSISCGGTLLGEGVLSRSRCWFEEPITTACLVLVLRYLKVGTKYLGR